MKESLRREIVVVLVGIGMLVGVFSGCMEETVKSNNAPVADFEWSPETVVVNETVQFTSTSSDADGDSLTYTWDFGDGSALSSEKDPTHIYTKVGLYNVTLKVSDGTDNDTITKTVNVGVKVTTNEAPTADFTYVVTNLTVVFTDNSTDDSNISAWAWDFDGDGVVDNTTQNPTYTYAAAGTYNVTLTVTDDDETTPLTGTVTKEITVTD